MTNGAEMSVILVVRAAVLVICIGFAPHSVGAADDPAQSPSAPPQASVGEPGGAESEIDVKKLFAAQCAWCHADYGLKAGKAPQLAGTRLTEKQVYNTI